MERDGMRTARRAALVALLWASSAASPQSGGPPLSGLPSAPGPHVAQIQAMADNTWLQLPLPAADPLYGRCMGRSWGARAAYSPALRAGFFYGEGAHGWWDSTTRRYMDDLWSYDVLANRWICLYPGAHVDNLSLSLNADGFEVDSSGQPIPVAQNVHGYEMLAFDTDLNKFMWMPCPGGYDGILDARRQSWGTGKGYRPSNCSPWMYDVASGRFQLRKTSGGFPGSSFGDSLVYVPGLRKLWFRRTSGVWFYDYATNAWSQANPSGPAPPFGIDATTCLDTVRNRIYIGGGSYPVVAQGSNAFWIYDLATNAWIDPQPQGYPGNSYATAYAFMNYDSVNDAVILVKHATNLNGVFIYDPQTNAWTQASSTIPGITNTNAFYDPGLRAVFVHSTPGDNRVGPMWVYKYKGSGGPAGPSVSVSAADPSAAEPADAGQLTFTRSGATTSALTVFYSVGGTAAGGADYASIGTSVTIGSGSASASVAVTPIDDAQAEGSETVIVTVSPNASYSIDAGSATVTIADNDSPPAGQPPSVSFTNPANGASLSGSLVVNARANDPDLGTADGAGIDRVVFELLQGTTVVATSPTEFAVTYDWSLNTTAYPDGSYTLRATATSTAAAGGTSASASITVTLANGGPPPPVDSDGDGLPDSWEQQHFQGLSETGSGDPDQDGASNAQEYAAGTDPMDAASAPGASSSGDGNGGCGATGLEALLLAGLALLRRRRSSPVRPRG